jgi:hypothetical protein
MSYSDFTFDKLQAEFDITMLDAQSLFDDVAPQSVSERLQSFLRDYAALAVMIGTEKARSEFIIAPILAELKFTFKERLSLFSGTKFNVDSKRGLRGECDFILSRSPQQLSLTAPAVVIVEAKKEDIIAGIPQCLSEMIAAQQFNRARKNDIDVIYGAVTTGEAWRFLKLYEQTASVDSIQYPIQQLDKIFGILVFMVAEEKFEPVL